MALSFTASVRGWTDKAKRNADLVVKGSISDVGELMTRRQPSVKETGGSFKEGFVPVDKSELINSQQVEINGGVVASGDVDYSAAIANMEIGDAVRAVFTAPHARRMEYGFSGTDSLGRTYNQAGRFFVRNAVQQWQTVVAQNAAQFRG